MRGEGTATTRRAQRWVAAPRTPGEGGTLAAAVAAVGPGGIVRLLPGVHRAEGELAGLPVTITGSPTGSSRILGCLSTEEGGLRLSSLAVERVHVRRTADAELHDVASGDVPDQGLHLEGRHVDITGGDVSISASSMCTAVVRRATVRRIEVRDAAHVTMVDCVMTEGEAAVVYGGELNLIRCSGVVEVMAIGPESVVDLVGTAPNSLFLEEGALGVVEPPDDFRPDRTWAWVDGPGTKIMLVGDDRPGVCVEGGEAIVLDLRGDGGRGPAEQSGPSGTVSVAFAGRGGPSLPV